MGSKALSDTIEGGHCIIEGGGCPAGRPAGGCNLSRLRYVHNGKGGGPGGQAVTQKGVPLGGGVRTASESVMVVGTTKKCTDSKQDAAQPSPAQPSPVSQAAGQPVGE